jgi:acetyl esterase/lipase
MSRLLSILLLLLTSCMKNDSVAPDSDTGEILNEEGSGNEGYTHITTNDSVHHIVNHPAFKGFGNYILPWDDNTYYYDTPLNNVRSLLPYHNHVDPDIVVSAINHMIDEINDGKTIFYDFYTEQQKQKDPTKEPTGLFFFRGKPGAPFAIVCPGGGFAYVGSLHEGFPYALELSKKGYNAFVLKYRVGSGLKATEDLAAAISYIFENAETLQVGTENYSLWGSSAGARMVGDIALNGVSAYGGGNLPKPATAVIAYTGQSTYSSDFSPAFITVAANDRIANVNTVERRVENLKNAGVDVEYRRYENAEHGFGLGTGTDAEGWVDLAVQFWQRQITGTLQNEIPQQIYLWE